MTITHSTVSTAPNTGRPGVIGSTAWNAAHVDSASPEAFGAVGDGLTDDSAAIQAAVNANSSITFTAGRTYVFKNVTLRNGSRIFAHGATMLAPAGSALEADSFFKADGTSGSHLSDILISGGTYSHGDRVGSVIAADYTDGITVEHCLSEDAASAAFTFANCTRVHLAGCRVADQAFAAGTNGGAITLDHCTSATITDCSTSNTERDGILAYYTTDVIVRGCRVQDFNMGDIMGRAGIHFYRSQRCVCSDNVASKTTPTDTTQDDASAIRFRNSYGFTCTGNDVNGGAFGIVVVQVNNEDTATGYGSITGNHITGCYGFGATLQTTAGYGIGLVNVTNSYLPNCFPITVTGNVIESLSNSVGYAIYGMYVNWLDCDISGNAVTQTPSVGILLAGAYYGRVENNVLSTCCTDGRNGLAGTCAVLLRSGSNFRVARNSIRGAPISMGFVTASGFNLDSTVVAEDNFCFSFTSTQQYSEQGASSTNARRLKMYGTAAPAAGLFNAGDIVVSSDTTGTYEYWRCTVGGSPGTWVGHAF